MKRYRVYLRVSDIYSVEIDAVDTDDACEMARNEYSLNMGEFENEADVDIEDIEEIEVEE